MKPVSFNYLKAETIEHAVELLDQYGDNAKIIAGGQSLIPMMNFRIARPETLIDIGSIKESNQIIDNGDQITISSTTKQSFVEESPLIRQELPVLYESVKHIGHAQIRNNGTIGGSIVHADPSAELPAVSLALDAEYEIVSVNGTSMISAEDFFITYMTTCLQENEILSNISFKKPPRLSGWGFQEIARREGDFALAGSIVVLGIDLSGKFDYARISLFGVDSTPVRAHDAEQQLIGETFSEQLFSQVAEIAKETIEPEGDLHGSAGYRKEICGELTFRALIEAYERIPSL
ncbi:xanthine dehydrogenase family protein subunit M [Neobacillus niacini]|uniref:FAD binding domain-containing protein n=1 Tax=Neobacillus niacini TaxID=86668 RepID=UPI0030023EEF